MLPHRRCTLAPWKTTALAMAASFAALGCETQEKACTLIGCQSGLVISFAAANWPAGTYQVVAQTPSGQRSCSVALPLASDGQATCTGAMTLGTSGSALPAAQHSLVGVQLPDDPTQVTLTVTRDGSQLANKAFAPAYKVSQPNGAGCEPVCKQASEQLSW